MLLFILHHQKNFGSSL